MNDVSLAELPTDFGRLRLLEKCELRDNCLKALPDSFSELVHLELLDIGANEFHAVPLVVCGLPNLAELLVDDNELRSLPPHIGQLQRLQQLDVSENLIDSLPEEVSGLVALSDLKLSQNNLSCLPGGIGHMKSLVVLKLDQNQLLTLTPSIGNCSSLQELYLTENLLPSLPSSVGNLSSLLLLNADKNQLTELPPQIGHCTSLTILSLRENMLRILPEDIGNCCRLRVLDVSGNRLKRLPPSLTNCPLTALWLSANQSQPVVSLQRDVDALTGEHFLTCYLLPQTDRQTDSQVEVGDTGLSPLELGSYPVPVPTSGDALSGDLARYYRDRQATEDVFSRIPAEDNYAYAATGGALGELIGGSRVAPSWSATSGDAEEFDEVPDRQVHPGRELANSPPADTSTASFSSRTTATVPGSPRAASELVSDPRHLPQSWQSSTRPTTGDTATTMTSSTSSSPTASQQWPAQRQPREAAPGDDLGYPTQLPGSRVHFSSALDADDQSEHSSAKDFPKTLHPRLVKKSVDGHHQHHGGRDNAAVDRVCARDRLLNFQFSSPAQDQTGSPSHELKVTSPPSGLESPPSLSAPRSADATVPTATSWRVPTGSPCPTSASSALSGNDRRTLHNQPLTSSAIDQKNVSPPRTPRFVDDPRVAPTAKPRTRLYGAAAHTTRPNAPTSSGSPRNPGEALRGAGSGSRSPAEPGDYEYNGEDEVGGEGYLEEDEEAYTSGGEEICGISKRVGFSDDVEDNEEKSNQKLIRRDTPHYTKRARIQSKAADGVENTEVVLKIMEKFLAGEATATATNDLHTAAQSTAVPTKDGYGSQPVGASPDHSLVTQVHIHRPHTGCGLGLSIAGGVGSVPYLGEDQGIFVSRLNPAGLAYASGLRLHDKLLQVNGTSLVTVEHKVAVAALRADTNDFHLMVLRHNPVGGGGASNGEQLFRFSTPTALPTSQQQPPQTWPAQETSGGKQPAPQLIKCTLRRDGSSGLGLSIAGGRGALPSSTPGRSETIVISKISENGAAQKCGTLRVGDQLIKVDGVDVKNGRHEHALLLLSGSGPTVDIEVLRSSDSPENHYLRTANGCDAFQPDTSAAPPLVPWLNEATPIKKKDAMAFSTLVTQSSDNPKSYSPSLSTKVSPANRDRDADGEIRRTDGSYSVDLITIRCDDNSPLGLTIYGGSDTCCRPFGGSTNEPGIFISKISPTGRASRSGLRVGDRLLRVNDRDLRSATHDEAVRALIESSTKELLLKVRHDPTPPGLRRLAISRQSGEGLGIRIAGGISPPGSSPGTEFPTATADDGLFVTAISADGAVARDGRVRLGDRLLEVNGTWVMGCTLAEALTCFHGTGAQLDLIVCDGPLEVVSQLSSSQTIVAKNFPIGIRRTTGPLADCSVDDANRMPASNDQKHQPFAEKLGLSSDQPGRLQTSSKTNNISVGPISNRLG